MIERRNSWRTALLILLALLAALAVGAVVAHLAGRWTVPPWLGLILFYFMLAFPLLFFGSLAAYMFGLARRSGALAAASRTWPTTKGKVLSSDIERAYAFRTGDVYTPIVRYEYAVGGRRYESDVVAFGMTSLKPRRKAEAYLAGRAVGAAVTVHYNPDDPAAATLDTSSLQARALRRSGWIFLAIPVFVYGLMALGFLK
jgi:hypothetical protein